MALFAIPSRCRTMDICKVFLVGTVACLLLYGLHTGQELLHGRATSIGTSAATSGNADMALDAARTAVDIVAHVQPDANRIVDADVWWFAPFFDHSSFGVEAAGYVLSLLREQLVPSRKLHVALLQNDCSDQQVGIMEDHDHAQLLELRKRPSEEAIVICHNLPPFLGRPAPRWRSCEPCPPPLWPGLVRYAVARAMAETNRIPADFVHALNSMDEVWVPTEASAAVLRESGVARRLVVVPLAVDTQELDRSRVQPLSLPPPNAMQVFGPRTSRKPSFIFISVFKWELRKGYDVLMRAFLEEFSPEPRQQSATVEQFRVTGPGNAVEARATGPAARAAIAGRRKGPAKAAEGPCSDKSDVVLYLLTKPFLPKASGAGLAEHVRKWARDAQPELDLNQVPRVYVMDGHVPRKDYVAMLAAADAFVLATRGEGWGLPILEAMSLGLPVIATNWSGPTAYLDERVGYPLSYSLKPVPSTEPYWFQGSQWAEPSVPHLRRLMRAIVSCSGRADAKARGEAALQRVQERFAQPVVSRLVAAELHRIASTTRGPRPTPGLLGADGLSESGSRSG